MSLLRIEFHTSTPLGQSASPLIGVISTTGGRLAPWMRPATLEKRIKADWKEGGQRSDINLVVPCYSSRAPCDNPMRRLLRENKEDLVVQTRHTIHLQLEDQDSDARGTT